MKSLVPWLLDFRRRAGRACLLGAFAVLSGNVAASPAGNSYEEAARLVEAGQGAPALAAAQRALDAARQKHGAASAEAAQSELLLGQACQRLGAAALAETHFRNVLAVQEKVLPPEAAEWPAALTHLASALEDQGRYEEAAPLLQRALDWQLRYRGFDDEETAVGYRNLGALQRLRHDFEQSALLLAKTLEIRRRLLGASAPETLLSLQELGEVHELRGDLTAAETLAGERAHIVEESAGANSPETAAALSTWAALAERQAHFSDAEPRWRRALAIRETALPAKDPLLATSQTNLGWCLKSLERYEEAAGLLVRALALRTQVLGEKHEEVAWSERNLGWVYRLQRDYARALPCFQRALEIRQRLGGETAPLTLESLAELGDLHWLRGAFPEAAAVFETRRQRVQKRFGAESAEAAAAWHSVALAWQSARRWPEARRAAEEAMKLTERRCGAGSPQALGELSFLAQVATEAGDFAPARAHYARIVAALTADPAAPPARRAEAVREFAVASFRAGARTEAEALFQQSRRLHESLFGADAPATLRTLGDLWTFYEQTGDTAQAHDLAEELAQGAERAMGVDAPATLIVFDRLGQLCLSVGNAAGAARWFQRAVDGRRTRLGPAAPELLTSLGQVAGWLEDAGAALGAIPFRRQRLAAIELQHGADSPEALTALQELGGALLAAREWEAASATYFQMLSSAEKMSGAGRSAVQQAVRGMGDAAAAAANWRQAAEWRQRAVNELTTASPPGVRAQALLELGDALLTRDGSEAAGAASGSGASPEAEAALLEARSLAGQAGEGGAVLAARVNCLLTVCASRRGDAAGAGQALSQALALAALHSTVEEQLAAGLLRGAEANGLEAGVAEAALERAMALLPAQGAGSALQVAILRRQALMRFWRRDPGAAEAFERALAASELLTGASSPATGDLCGWLALARVRGAESRRALAAAARLLAIRRSTWGEDHPQTALAHLLHGALLWQSGEASGAREDGEQAAAVLLDAAPFLAPLVAQGLALSAAVIPGSCPRAGTE